jgi:hypothetical protein
MFNLHPIRSNNRPLAGMEILYRLSSARGKVDGRSDGCRFALHGSDDTIGDMIAMASPFAGYMTVRLAGTLIPGHGWMIQRKSVAKFLEEESSRPAGVGFPRGRDRSGQEDEAAAEPRKPAKRAAKSAKPAKKSRGG